MLLVSEWRREAAALCRMEGKMRKKGAMLLMSVLSVVTLLIAGCVPDDPGPEQWFLDAEEALEAALVWLQENYPDEAPDPGILWTVEDIEILGEEGTPLPGAARKHFSSDDWNSVVSWAIVEPDSLSYHITLTSPTLGWYWEGSVRGVGGIVAEEISLQQMTPELAVDLAAEFVRNSPTFRFDGIQETLEVVDVTEAASLYSWVVEVEFDSRNAGYGDRTGEPVLTVITPHTALITVEQMRVTEAIMDGRWDMLAQEFVVTEVGARQEAENFIRNSPTFVFDGIPETLEMVEVLPVEEANTWTFVFRFDSSHAGYGDRTGQVLLPVITSHEAHITVANNVVVNAVLNDEWDMIEQEFIAITEETSRKVAEEFVRSSPTFVFDGIPETLELVETLEPDIENAWTFVFHFDSLHAGYGDRTGEAVAQVITPHEAHITVEDGEVISALMDEQWDMIQQEMVQ